MANAITRYRQHLESADSEVSCHKKIANTFNKYFTALARNLNKNIDTNSKNLPDFRTFLPKSVQNSIFLSDTTSEEVISIINEFQNTKSSDIPINAIKHVGVPLHHTSVSYTTAAYL